MPPLLDLSDFLAGAPGRAPQGARATIVMTARERHGLTERSIDAIQRGTARPYRLIYADGSTPAAIRTRLAARTGDRAVEVVRVDPAWWPNQIRHRIVAGVDTDYVVFIDNDVIVEPGWLDALVACADETGAGVVGPFTMIGGGNVSPRVHMTVGALRWEDTPTGRTLSDLHVDNDEEPAAVAARAVRSPSDYAEYHCLLVRTAAARDGAPFDQAICCVHEHIDLSLAMKERGFATWFEPAARVTYLAVEPWALGDLGYRRRRWDRAAGESSIRAFARKWGVADDDRSFGKVRSFLHAHQARLDPLDPRWIGSPDLVVPMLPAELPQTRSSLLDLAIARGYAPDAVLVIARQCDNVTLMMNGGYRPCGRPFVAHLIGTAGVLVRYGFRIEIVLAGLMHAAYSHCPAVSPRPKSAIEAVCDALGGPGAPVERRVRAYTRRAESLRPLAGSRDSVDDMGVDEAEIVAIVAANEVDMALSGEHRYTTRDDRLGADEIALVRRVCAALGVEGLGVTLEAAAAAPSASPELRTRFPVSYRIDGMTFKPMASQAFFAFDRALREKERAKATG